MTFGERIIESRKKLHLNQKQLAEILGITPTRLNYWENNKREPDIAMIKAIAEVLDVSADYLIGNNAAYSNANEEAALIDALHQLNEEGREKLLDYADDLVQSGKYIKIHPDKLVEKET